MLDILIPRISELFETRNSDNSITMATLALLIQVQNYKNKVAINKLQHSGVLSGLFQPEITSISFYTVYKFKAA